MQIFFVKTFAFSIFLGGFLKGRAIFEKKKNIQQRKIQTRRKHGRFFLSDLFEGKRARVGGVGRAGLKVFSTRWEYCRTICSRNPAGQKRCRRLWRLLASLRYSEGDLTRVKVQARN